VVARVDLEQVAVDSAIPSMIPITGPMSALREARMADTKACRRGYTISDEMSVKKDVSPVMTTFR
jgi:hypothetical protein